MISYKLAKKLKDAGFPQSRDSNYYAMLPFGHLIVRGRVHGFVGINTEYVAIPTLSELIDACGNAFKRLEKSGDSQVRWYAVLFSQENDGWGDVGIQIWGDSREEAVARVWLELNK